MLPGLLDALTGVVDSRARHGVRYQLVTILAVSICAVTAGFRSLVAIAVSTASSVEVFIQVNDDRLARALATDLAEVGIRRQLVCLPSPRVMKELLPDSACATRRCCHVWK